MKQKIIDYPLDNESPIRMTNDGDFVYSDGSKLSELIAKNEIKIRENNMNLHII